MSRHTSYASTVHPDHPLLISFYRFYEEVLRQKERALRESQGIVVSSHTNEDSAHDDATESTDQNIENSSDKTDIIHESLVTQRTADLSHDIQRRLRIALELCENNHDDSAQPHITRAMYDTTRYLMAALADEIFLTLNWCGQATWQRYLLELDIFHTHVAGEAVFEKLDALLSRVPSTPHAQAERDQLIPLYFFCLSLGFRGRYRGPDHDEVIASYKARLYQHMYGQTPSLGKTSRTVLNHDVYHHNISMPYGKALPDVRRWIITFASVLGVYLFVTYVLWYKVVRDIDEATHCIFEQARYLPL